MIVYFQAIEWFWVLLALFFVVLAFVGLANALGDVRALAITGINGTLKRVARRRWRGAYADFIIANIFFWVGVSNLFAAPTPSQLAPTYQVWAFYLGHLTILVLSCLRSGFDQWDYSETRRLFLLEPVEPTDSTATGEVVVTTTTTVSTDGVEVAA